MTAIYIGLIIICTGIPNAILDYVIDKIPESRCEKVYDIYCYPSNTCNKEYFIRVGDCPFTLNYINQNIATLTIERGHWKGVALEYEGFGLRFPYQPQRFDSDVYYPNL